MQHSKPFDMRERECLKTLSDVHPLHIHVAWVQKSVPLILREAVLLSTYSSMKSRHYEVCSLHVKVCVCFFNMWHMHPDSVWVCVYAHVTDCQTFSWPSITTNTRIYRRYTGNFQCKQRCVVDVWDWLREKQSCLKSHLGWEAAHMESYQIVLILLIGCSTLNRSSC